MGIGGLGGGEGEGGAPAAGGDALHAEVAGVVEEAGDGVARNGDGGGRAALGERQRERERHAARQFGLPLLCGPGRGALGRVARRLAGAALRLRLRVAAGRGCQRAIELRVGWWVSPWTAMPDQHTRPGMGGCHAEERRHC